MTTPFAHPVSPKKPNWVSSVATDEPHRVEPLPIRGTPAASLASLRTILESMPRTRISQQTDTTLRAEVRSLIFRFVDDIEFVAADDRVDVQSRSRLGHSDLGVNRRRVDSIRERYVEPSQPSGD